MQNNDPEIRLVVGERIAGSNFIYSGMVEAEQKEVSKIKCDCMLGDDDAT